MNGLIHQQLVTSSAHLEVISEMRSGAYPYIRDRPVQLKVMGLHKYNAT